MVVAIWNRSESMSKKGGGWNRSEAILWRGVVVIDVNPLRGVVEIYQKPFPEVFGIGQKPAISLDISFESIRRQVVRGGGGKYQKP